ncbi:MAG: TolC family protein [Bacteroidota bacterium]|nr:TolC family protein [Bacteroidota bacterium]
MKFYNFFLSLLLVAWTSTGTAIGQGSWSLRKCIDYAIAHNLQVKQQEVNARMSENTYLQSRLDVLPNLNASGGFNYSLGRALDQTTYQFTSNQKIKSSNFSVNSSVNLFSGFQQANTIKQNHFNLMASLSNVEKVKNDISLNIASAFLQILFCQELLEVANNQLELSQQQVDHTRTLYNAGSVPQGKLFEIQAQAASDELQVVNSQNSLDLSKLTLIQLLDLDSIKNFEIEKPNLGFIKIDTLEFTIDSVFNRAQELPQIRAAQYSLLSAEKGLAIAKAERSPRLTLGASYGSGYSDIRERVTGLSDFQTFPIGKTQTTGETVVSLPAQTPIYGNYPFNNQIKDNANTNIMLGLSIPIFNGWKANSSIANAKLAMVNSKYSLQNAKNMLYKDICQAYTDALAALKKYRATDKALSSIEESFKYTQQKYEIGLMNFVDYSTVKNQLAKTQSELLQAKYEYIFKLKVLDFYKGNPITL